jgi:PIN domain nuclease of toxin-antitoxin system
LSAFLVDTHALLWFLTDDRRLSATAKSSIESGENIVLVSASVLWEIAVKANLGKLDVPSDLPAVLRDQGFEELGVTADHAWNLRDLPIGEHRDPFDRLLAAQALAESLPVISGDPAFDEYGVRRVW